MIAIFLQGSALGAGLIIAIGAQNAYVLRQGLKRQHHFAIATLCSLIDMGLILVGGLGIGSLIAANAWLYEAVTLFGAGFVAVYGALAMRRAVRGEQLNADRPSTKHVSLKTALLTALGFSLLNPHVYLDTVVLLGSLSGMHPWPDRAWFLGGAMCASVVWFYALALAAERLAPLFSKPATWRILDSFIALIMWWIAASLIWDRFF